MQEKKGSNVTKHRSCGRGTVALGLPSRSTSARPCVLTLPHDPGTTTDCSYKLPVSTANVNIVCDASDNLTDSTGSLLHDSCTTTECSYRLHVSTANVNAVCDSDNLTDIIGILPHEPCTATDCSYKLHVSTANGNAVCDQASNLTDSTGKRLAGSATGSSQENYFTNFATTACGSSVSRHFTD